MKDYGLEVGKVTFQDQHVRDLRLVVANGYIDPDQFCVIEQKILEYGPMRIEASIIGASHCINVRFDGENFAELFACVRYDCKEDHVEIDPWNKGLIISLFPKTGIVSGYVCLPSYANMEMKRREIDDIVRRTEASAGMETEVGLIATFPAGPDCSESRTIVHCVWDVRSSFVVTETVHEYPNEGLAAFTRSEMRIGKKEAI